MAARFEPEQKTKLPKKDYKKGELPDTKEGWVRYINDLHDSGLSSRRKYEFQWVVNLSYYLGYQHLLFNPRTGLLEMPRELKNPLIINRIRSFVQSRHAKLTKQRPVTRVLPNTADLVDRKAAQFADHALLYLWRKIDMETEYDKLIMQMLICGTSFCKTLWDPSTGDVIADYKKGTNEDELFMDEDGSIVMEEIFMGEVSSKAISPFNIIPGSDAVQEIKDQPWMMERSHVTVMDLERIYPHLKGKLKTEDKYTDYTDYERIVQRLGSPIFKSNGVGTDNGPRDELNSQALVKTFFMKPNHQYQDGIVAVVVGSELAMIDKFPNDFGDNVYPYVKFTECQDGFHFWNQATIEAQIPIQRAYNRIKQGKLKNVLLMSAGKYLLPKGSQVHEDSITDEEGEIIEYNPAVPKPEQLQMAPLPGYVSELGRELIVDFRDVGGQRESSVTPPPNVTAGVAMQTAAELADEIIGPIIRRLSKSMEKVGNQQLLIMDQEYQEPRLVKIVGDHGPASVMYLSAADFRHHTDVHIEIESMFPEFRGAKRQTLLDLWDRRIIQDPVEFINAFRFGTFDEIVRKSESKEEAVALDIQRIKKGKEPEITQFQDHAKYVKLLSEWIQTPDFGKLIPERKQLALAVLQAHLQFIMQQMQGPAGAPQPEQNQAAVGTQFGPQVPAA